MLHKEVVKREEKTMCFSPKTLVLV